MRFRFSKWGITLLFLIIALRLGWWRTQFHRWQSQCRDWDSAPQERTQVTGVVESSASGMWLKHLAVHGNPIHGAETRGRVLGGWGVKRLAQRQRPFPGKVALTQYFFSPPLRAGTQISLSGIWRCRPVLRNPGKLADGLLHWATPTLMVGSPRVEEVIPTKVSWRLKAKEQWREWLQRPFWATKNLQGLVTAVWLGELSQLPEWLVSQYQEAGLIPILALSGQHVACLSFLVMGILKVAVAPLFGVMPYGLRRYYCTLCQTVPVLTAFFLWFTAAENPPILRALSMVIVLSWLKWRRLHCSSLQLLTSSVAALVVWDPSLLGKPGFFLSAVATGFLAVLVFSFEILAIKKYVFFSLVMPVAFFPMGAFFFAKVSWASPVMTLLVSWFWDVCLLPLIFIAPFVAHSLPSGLSAKWVHLLARGWDWVLEEHARWGSFQDIYLVTLRPTWWELVWVGGLALGIFLFGKNIVFRRSL